MKRRNKISKKYEIIPLSCAGKTAVNTVPIVPFKLYDNLVESIKNTPVEKYVISNICSTIGNFLTIEHRNLLFLIIYHHYQLHNNKSKKTCPYNGNVYPIGKGVSFNMNNFPDDLVHLIVRYIGIASGIEDL